MAQFLVKRSMSPDGKIDSVSVELSFEAEVTDTQTVLDAIAITDQYADYVRTKEPAPRVASNVGQTTSDGGQGTIIGAIRAVYPGEPSKSNPAKNGPGAIIIDSQKVKTFDKKEIQRAEEFKANGTVVEATFKRNEQWKSNDLVSLKAATQ